MRLRSLLILVIPVFMMPTLAAKNTQTVSPSLKQKIEQAITHFEQTSRSDWAFQITRYENEEGDITSSIERFNPELAHDHRWQLVRLNGEKPTNKQQKSFIDKKLNNNAESKSFAIKLRELVNLDELKLLDIDESYMTVSFPVQFERLGADAEGKLQGTLRYNQQQQFIEEVVVANNAEFSPMFGASISELMLTLNFITIDKAILPHQHKLNMKGRFAYFTEIDELSTDTYSDYEFKGHKTQ